LLRIREFISSRGPDNKALRETFDRRVESFFAAGASEEYKKVTGLSVKEKMLVLFILEAQKRERGETPNPEILDPETIFWPNITECS
jgi:hypothetical protein